jgi:transketolase
LGKTYLLKGGKDVLLVSTGPQSQRCLEAANLLDQQQVSAGVPHVPSIKPLNREELIQACEPFKTIITVEEHNVHGGLGGLVCEVLSEQSPKNVRRTSRLASGGIGRSEFLDDSNLYAVALRTSPYY